MFLAFFEYIRMNTTTTTTTNSNPAAQHLKCWKLKRKLKFWKELQELRVFSSPTISSPKKSTTLPL